MFNNPDDPAPFIKYSIIERLLSFHFKNEFDKVQNKSSDNKRIAKNTLFLYTRSIFLLVITLYTSRITLKILGVEDYGVYNLIAGVVTLFMFLQSAMSSASQRFITYALGERDYSKLKRVFQTSVTLHLVFAFILALIIEVVGLWLLEYKLSIPNGRMDAARWVLHFSTISAFLGVICVPYDSLIVAHEKMSAFAYIGIYEAIAKLIAVWLLIFWGADRLIAFAFLNFCVSASLRIIYQVYAHKNFEESRNIKLKIDKVQFKEMFAFAGWNLLGNGSYVLRNQGISILLNVFFGVVVNAASGICNQVQHGVMLFVKNFQTAVNPQLTKSIASKDYIRSHTLIFQGGRFSFYLLSVFAVPLLICTNEILELWLEKVPEWSADLTRFTLVYFLFDVLSRFLINSILATGNIRNYELIVGGIKLLALPLTYVFLLMGGNPITGVFVNILLEIVCFIVRLFYNRKRIHFPVKPYLTKVFVVCWFVFICSLTLSWLFKQYLVSNVFFAVPASVTIVIICVTLIGISDSERKLVLSYIRKRLHKKS